MSRYGGPRRERRAIAVFATVLAVFSVFLYWQLDLAGGNGELLSADDVPARPHADLPLEAPPRAPEPALPSSESYPIPPELRGIDLSRQSAEEAAAKSRSCIACHQGVCDPHMKSTVRLGCIDCHGGDATATDKEHSHVFPRFPDAWPASANPVRSYTLLNHESPEFVRFVNPGDLRIAHLSCGTANCHASETLQVKKSMMTHGCMLWGAALYNNGSVPEKWARFGESYSMNGRPQRLQTVPPPSQEDTEKHGVLPRSTAELSNHAAREHPADFRARRAIQKRDSSPGTTRRIGPPSNAIEQPRIGDADPYGPCVYRAAEDATAGSNVEFPRNQRPSRGLPFERMHGLPCDLCQRSLTDPCRTLRAVW
jgi:hypothetical protein